MTLIQNVVINNTQAISITHLHYQLRK